MTLEVFQLQVNLFHVFVQGPLVVKVLVALLARHPVFVTDLVTLMNRSVAMRKVSASATRNKNLNIQKYKHLNKSKSVK